MEWLSPLGFELFPTIVVDLLHEFELGVVKNILKHLIQILYCVDSSRIALLNERCAHIFHSGSNMRTYIFRYSMIPPFGTDTIRRFPENVADMCQQTARHFEDMLQVSS
jgi:hypothetical protein